jgi:hypothetical protein
MRFMHCAAAAAASLAGCGYSVGHLQEYPAAIVPIFGSQSERRGAEFELHKAVCDELKAQGVRVNDGSASVELRGLILDITEPALVEGSSDQVVVGSVAFRLEITLVSRTTGEAIWTRVLEETAPFSAQRLQTRDTARQAVIDRLARRVASMLEKEM